MLIVEDDFTSRLILQTMVKKCEHDERPDASGKLSFSFFYLYRIFSVI